MESLGLLNTGMTDKSLIAISPWPPPMLLAKNTVSSHCCPDDPLLRFTFLGQIFIYFLIVKGHKSYS